MEEYHCKQREQIRSLTSLKDLKIPSQQDIIVQFTSSKQTNGRIQSRGHLIYDNQHQQSVYEKFVLIDKYKTQKDYDMLSKSLSTHFVFGQLTSDKDVLTALLDSFVCCEVTAGVYLIQQGEDASSFFVLDSGALQVQFNGKVKKHIKPHQSFGQLALLHNCPRSASVKASETSILWMITRPVFKSIVQQTFKNQYIRARKYIQKLGVFGGLTSRQKDSLANIFKYKCYEKGDVIAEQNKPITSYFFLQKGRVKLFKDNSTTQMQAQIGECICDQILQDDFERIYTIQAGQNCCVYQVNKNGFHKILGKQLHQMMFRNRVYPYLINSKYFSQLPKNILQKVIDTFEIRTIQPGEVIVNLGYLKRNMMFFILQQYTEDEGPIFLYGQEAILEENQQDIYRQKIIVEKPSYLAFTNFKKVQTVIQIKFEKICARQLRFRQLVKQHSLVNTQFRDYAMKLKPSDLFHVKKLAEGSSGGVHLVVDINKKYLYALKCIQRQDIQQKKLQKSVLEQRKALQISESPFLMQYGRCFKDQSYVCFLTEYVDGMQFFDVIRFMGLVSPKDSKFYIANIIFALQHLHKRDIIYRGLKPQNILVNWDGYLKLTDMKTCKTIVNKNIVPKTFTMVGTPHYIAPEILKAKGYNHSVDLWSLGIILYQLVCGSVPFGAYDDDPFDIYEAILKRQIKYPSTLKDIKCKYLIEQLLSRFPQARLKGSYSNLKSHQFFEGISWDKIFQKTVEPPYKVPEDKLLGRYLNKLNVKKLKNVEDYFMKKNIKCARISARMSALATSLANWDQNFN